MNPLDRAPRCPKCGKPPPIRRVTLGDSQVRITNKCGDCGTKYEIATDSLALDADVEPDRRAS